MALIQVHQCYSAIILFIFDNAMQDTNLEGLLQFEVNNLNHFVNSIFEVRNAVILMKKASCACDPPKRPR